MSDNIRPLRRPEGGASRRLRANWPAELRGDGGQRIKCTIIDLSSAGARVRLEGDPGDISNARLVIETLPPIATALAWRRRDQAGLRFAAEQGWVLDLCAERFDPAAWLRGPQ
jgi:hypothetical protein